MNEMVTIKDIKQMMIEGRFQEINEIKVEDFEEGNEDQTLTEEFIDKANFIFINDENHISLKRSIFFLCLQENILLNNFKFNKRFFVESDEILTKKLIYDISNENLKFLLDFELNYEAEVYFYGKCWEKGIDILPFVDKIAGKYLIGEVSDEFIYYIFENLKLESITFPFFKDHVIDTKDDKLADILIKKGFRLDHKLDYNLDFFLSYCLCHLFHPEIENIEFLLNKFNYHLSTDVLDKQYLNNHSNSFSIELPTIELLSTLENFDDFLNNNFFLLMKKSDEESFNYLLRYK